MFIDEPKRLAKEEYMPEYEAQKGYWDGIGQRRSPDHPAVRAFSRPKIEVVLAELGRGKSMLEVGAGNGYFSYALATHFDLIALDFSLNMLKMSPVLPERKVQGDAERLPFGDDSFEIVLCANLLHHLSVPAFAVREMARVARRNVVLRDLGRECDLRLRRFVTQGSVVPNRTPPALLPWLRVFDRPHPLGFYNIAIFDVES